MCLWAISKRYRTPRRGYGLKIVVRRRDGTIAPFFMYGVHRYQVGEWYDAIRGGDAPWLFADAVPYRPGFHIYQTASSAMSRRCHKNSSIRVAVVEYDGAHTLGIELYDTVIVASRMRIISTHTSRDRAMRKLQQLREGNAA